MKRLSVFFLFLVFMSCIPCRAADYLTDTFTDWLQQVADGIEDINAERWPFDEATNYMSSEPHRAALAKNPNSLPIVSDRILDIRKLPYELIAKVLGRRDPIVNSYKFPPPPTRNGITKPTYNRYVYGSYSNVLGGATYMTMTWQRMLILLILCEDMRFEKEVDILMYFLMEPMSLEGVVGKPRLIYEMSCSGPTMLRELCINYLNLFRHKRGEPRMNVNDMSTWTGYSWSKYVEKYLPPSWSR
ncbi:hypothetical protein MASR1M12_38670 [Erysipelotrichia bacterium]